MLPSWAIVKDQKRSYIPPFIKVNEKGKEVKVFSHSGWHITLADGCWIFKPRPELVIGDPNERPEGGRYKNRWGLHHPSVQKLNKQGKPMIVDKSATEKNPAGTPVMIEGEIERFKTDDDLRKRFPLFGDELIEALELAVLIAEEEFAANFAASRAA